MCNKFNYGGGGAVAAAAAARLQLISLGKWRERYNNIIMIPNSQLSITAPCLHLHLITIYSEHNHPRPLLCLSQNN